MLNRLLELADPIPAHRARVIEDKDDLRAPSLDVPMFFADLNDDLILLVPSTPRVIPVIRSARE